MKIISVVSFLASLAAGVALPLPLEIVGYMFVVVGIGMVMAQDYSCRRALRFETNAPVAEQFTARFFFHRDATAPRVTFRAPALSNESNRLAA